MHAQHVLPDSESMWLLLSLSIRWWGHTQSKIGATWRQKWGYKVSEFYFSCIYTTPHLHPHPRWQTIKPMAQCRSISPLPCSGRKLSLRINGIFQIWWNFISAMKNVHQVGPAAQHTELGRSERKLRQVSRLQNPSSSFDRSAVTPPFAMRHMQVAALVSQRDWHMDVKNTHKGKRLQDAKQACLQDKGCIDRWRDKRESRLPEYPKEILEMGLR